MTEKEVIRIQRWRLAIICHAQEVSLNVAKTCRYYGISRQAYYNWYQRYLEFGEKGLKDRSRRPVHSPRATRSEVIAKIVYLRQMYHSGPWKIKMYLQRYHDIQICSSGVWRILKRLQINRLPYNQRYRKHEVRWKRYEKPEPGHRIQVDVKFLERIPGTTRKRYYQFIDYVLSRLPFRTQVIQTDNGAEFQAQFHWHVLDKGINHVYIKPRRPRLNGKVERSHRIDEEEFYRWGRMSIMDTKAQPTSRPA